jgi:DNA-binding MarR family transcriptional regulator
MTQALPETEGMPETEGTPGRETLVAAIVAGYERLMRRLAEQHAPDFLEIAVTMPQAKVLYVVGAAGELHMSELASRLGVGLSTVSGLVDRLVDQGLVDRRDDPADRRQVLLTLTAAGAAFLDRFRELNARQLRALLALLETEELEEVRRALDHLDRAAAALAADGAT